MYVPCNLVQSLYTCIYLNSVKHFIIIIIIIFPGNNISRCMQSDMQLYGLAMVAIRQLNNELQMVIHSTQNYMPALIIHCHAKV